MANVQFFQGTYNKLAQTPLQEGAVYFIPSLRRLYIDTASRRIPIVGSAGVAFYIHLTPEDWNTSTNSQTVYYYDESKTGDYSASLSDILGGDEEAIVFIGSCYQGTNYDTLDEDYIVYCSANTASSLTFIVNEIPTEDIYVYAYVPNPDWSSIDIPIKNTIYTTNITISGVGAVITTNSAGWQYNASSKKYTYSYTISDLNLTSTSAYFLNLSDDSIENQTVFEMIEKVTVDTSDETSATFTFQTKEGVVPTHDMRLDLFAILDATQSGQDIITISTPADSEYLKLSDKSEFQFTKSAPYVSVEPDIPGNYIVTGSFTEDYPDEERIILGFRPDIDFTDNETTYELDAIQFYNLIQEITYTGGHSPVVDITFDATSLADNTTYTLPCNFTIVLIQLNGYGDIYKVRVPVSGWSDTSVSASEAGLDSITDANVVINKVSTTLDGTAFTNLNVNKPQLIYSSSSYFDQIIEERTIDKTYMLFYAEENNVPAGNVEVTVFNPA